VIVTAINVLEMQHTVSRYKMNVYQVRKHHIIKNHLVMDS